ncbi:gp58-like family protein [Streptococcus uberis]|uniref:phage tail spike protein n=1 Tax=Streptococcus uberis TaxID=1349 RepID=UPI0021500C4C|nr:phage tail spike protein [Streptococcus uberis]MCR4256923.1 gp58-like family protein [Streptococcus uberis]
MLYYYGAKTGVVDYNGSPLPEVYFAEIEEERNGEYKLIVKYPLSDTDNHLSLLENDLISAPTPQHGRQFFRIKNKVESLDEVVLTCYHIAEDIFIRKVKPLNVITKSCQVALDLLIAGSQTALMPFTFQSDITDVHTFTTDKEDTLYNLLLDGKHSIVGTWEGEIVRDNYNISIPKERGADRGVVISTHYNLEDYVRESDTTGVVTRITGVNDKGLSITVDSPIINALPYINEATFTNNNITDGAEMKMWLERKFSVEKIDKPKAKYTIKAFEVDGQTVHLGDYVTVKSKAHRVDGSFKIVAYKYDALEQVYTEFTFSENAWSGGISRSGLSGAVAEILNVNNSTEEELQRKLDNANAIFDKKQSDLKEEIQQGIVASEVKAEEQIAVVNGKISEVQAQANIMDSAIKDADAKASLALSNVTTVTNDLTKVKNDLSSAQTTLQADIDSLEATTNQTITDLNKTKTDLLAQASSMSSLTTRMTDVETTANGTKTTVTQLSKSVNDLTGSVDGVTQEVKTVQDNLDGVYTTLSKIQVGGNNLAVGTSSEYSLPKTTWTGGTNQTVLINKVYTSGLTVGDDVYVSIQLKSTDVNGANSVVLLQGSGNVTGWSTPFPGSSALKINGNVEEWIRYSFKITAEHLKNTYFNVYLRFDYVESGSVSWRNFKVEKGTLPTAWTPAIQDSSIEMANYKQAIDGQLTELKRTTETNANNIETNKTTIETTVNGIKTDISALQTYVNEDGTRTTAMQTYVQEENAKQTTALRTEVSNTYASKSEVTASVNGLTAKYENIRVGSRNYILSSDVYIQTGSLNKYFTLSSDFAKNANNKSIAISYEVESSNLSLRASGNRYGFEIKVTFTDNSVSYYGLWMTGTNPVANQRISKIYDLPKNKTILKIDSVVLAVQIDGNVKIGRPQVEIATVATDWSPAPEDNQSYTNTKIAEYKQTVDQNYASLSAQVGTKVNTSTFDQTVNGINTNIATLTNDLNGTKTSFQAVKETSDLYQRVLGKTEGDITSNVTNIIATSDVIQTTISKAVDNSSNGNIIYDSSRLSKWQKTNDLADVRLILSSTANLLKITSAGNTTNVNYGFKIPLTSNFPNFDETYSYRFVLDVDVIPDAGIIVQLMYNNYAFGSFQINPTKTGNNQVFTGTFVPYRANETDEYALNVKIVKNGTVSFHQMMIVKGSAIPTEFSDNTNLQLINTAKQTTAMQTQVTQLADSYAIKVLNSSKDIITRINMDYNGITLQGRLIHLDGQTLIDNAVIKDAHILNVDAGKIKTGYLDANRIATGSITADKMVVDSALINKLTANDALINNLTAKSAFITSVKAIDISGDRISGGVISALNGNMKIDLNGSKISFFNDAKIEFNSRNNAIFRKRNGVTGFFELADDAAGGVYAGLGVTSNDVGINSDSSGYFAGVRIFRANDSTDRIDFYGDDVTFGHSFTGGGRLYWKKSDYKGYDWNLFEILRAFNSGMKNLGQSYFQELGF